MEIDHLFICVQPQAREADLLGSFGLTEGTANRHPGQGTANRRFFFGNLFIELLFLIDPAEAQSPLTRPTRLYERLTSNSKTTSPFGICFRPSGNGPSTAPFETYSYQPSYLPADMTIDISPASLREPMWFFSTFGSRPDQAPPDRRQPLQHPKGFQEITSLHITIPGLKTFSQPAHCATEAGIEIERGNDHLLQIGFDQQSRGQSHDFHPLLPLLFRW